VIKKNSTYKDSGVNIVKGEILVEKIKNLSRNTHRKETLGSIGGFGALFQIPSNYNNPVLVSGADGVGTKLKLAFQSKLHKVVGIDLVAMSVNDILVLGAEPLFFLDYFACGSLSVDTAEKVIEGIVEGCQISGCSLIGGETAEMPGMYSADEYDLAGFAVGVVEKDKIINGENIKAGDQILGFPSSGLHSNGFSLVRMILERVFGKNYMKKIKDFKLSPTGGSLLNLLMTPTRIYVDPVSKILKNHFFSVHGLSHITGGGPKGNIPRVIPSNLKAVVEKKNFPRSSLIDWLQREGNVSDEELFSVFNAGIGMVLIVDKNCVNSIKNMFLSNNNSVVMLGEIKKRQSEDLQIEIC